MKKPEFQTTYSEFYWLVSGATFADCEFSNWRTKSLFVRKAPRRWFSFSYAVWVDQNHILYW